MLWLLIHPCISPWRVPAHPVSAKGATSSCDFMVSIWIQGSSGYPWVWDCLHSLLPSQTPLTTKTHLCFSFQPTPTLSLLVPPSFQFWSPTLNFFLLSMDKFNFLKHWSLEIQAKPCFCQCQKRQSNSDNWVSLLTHTSYLAESAWKKWSTWTVTCCWGAEAAKALI